MITKARALVRQGYLQKVDGDREVWIPAGTPIRPIDALQCGEYRFDGFSLWKGTGAETLADPVFWIPCEGPIVDSRPDDTFIGDGEP